MARPVGVSVSMCSVSDLEFNLSAFQVIELGYQTAQAAA
jgi:hypothetical protein